MENNFINYETGKINELNSELAAEVVAYAYNLNLDKEDILRKEAEECYRTVYTSVNEKQAMDLQLKLLHLKKLFENMERSL